MRTVCVTGHRPNKLWGYNLYTTEYIALGKKLRAILLNQLEQFGELHTISGVALGVDTLFALVVLKLRDEGHQITLECAVPCKNHSCKWNSDSKQLYQSILDRADTVTIVNNLPYSPQLMQLRNQYMVDRSNLVIAVWDGTSGGTANCVNYAQQHSVEIVRIVPNGVE